MKITRAGSTPSAPGPGDYFTGTVRIDPMFQADAPGRTSGAHVTFEPGARTAWHTHPAGQTIIITFGRGRVQRDGGPKRSPRATLFSFQRMKSTGTVPRLTPQCHTSPFRRASTARP